MQAAEETFLVRSFEENIRDMYTERESHIGHANVARMADPETIVARVPISHEMFMVLNGAVMSGLRPVITIRADAQEIG